MPIIVRSPYSGRPVKVRDQDINRAVRDEQGRVFYVIQRSDGQGYYSAPTRHGSDKDEQHYLELEAQAGSLEAEQVDQPPEPAPVHDATGRRRRSPVRTVVTLILLLLILAALAYSVLVQLGYDLPGAESLPFGPEQRPMQPSTPPAQPVPPEAEPVSNMAVWSGEVFQFDLALTLAVEERVQTHANRLGMPTSRIAA